MQEGYRTLVGDGTGAIIAWPLLLQLALARALVRQPRLLLLDDADQFAAAVGQQRLVDLLAQLQSAGVAILVAAARPEPLLADGSIRAEVLCLQDGALLGVSAGDS